MRVNPSKHFPENIGEVGPDYGDDRKERRGHFFRRLYNSADCCAGLMDRAETCFCGAAAAPLAARTKIKARTLIGAVCGTAGERQSRNSEIIGIIALFVYRPDTEFAA